VIFLVLLHYLSERAGMGFSRAWKSMQGKWYLTYYDALTKKKIMVTAKRLILLPSLLKQKKIKPQTNKQTSSSFFFFSISSSPKKSFLKTNLFHFK